MIVSRGRSYVFVHIPKTGGTSLSVALENRAMRNDILIGDTPKAKKRKRRLATLNARGRLWKHSTLADIDGVVSPDELSEMFLFTLVRNPWDRVVSYYHWLRAQSFDHPSVQTARHMSFPEFLHDRAATEPFRRWPARAYMLDANGNERCNLYIRLEHFEADAKPLFDHLGFSFKLPHINQSNRHAAYRGYYSEGLEVRVADLFAEDIARFGYDF